MLNLHNVERVDDDIGREPELNLSLELASRSVADVFPMTRASPVLFVGHIGSESRFVFAANESMPADGFGEEARFDHALSPGRSDTSARAERLSNP